MTKRPRIPAELERHLMIETGWRCAIPRCEATEPLHIDHIKDWSKVKKHEFSNMIVLCASCHGRKKNSSSPRHINRASLFKIKQNLMLLNGRYSFLERRLLDVFRTAPLPYKEKPPATVIHHTMGLLVQSLINDGLVTAQHIPTGIVTGGPDGIQITNDQLLLILTDKGAAFLDELNIET